VDDVKFEEIEPTLDAPTLDAAKELKFLIPASKDYFTRWVVIIGYWVSRH
jgi:hypothetical protein